MKTALKILVEVRLKYQCDISDLEAWQIVEAMEEFANQKPQEVKLTEQTLIEIAAYCKLHGDDPNLINLLKQEYAQSQEVKQEDKLDDMKPHIEHLRKRIDEIRPQIAGLGSMESAIRSLEDIYSQSELNKTSPLPKQVINVTDEQIEQKIEDVFYTVFSYGCLDTNGEQSEAPQKFIKFMDEFIGRDCLNKVRSLLSPVVIEPDGWICADVFTTSRDKAVYLQEYYKLDGDIKPVYFSPQPKEDKAVTEYTTNFLSDDWIKSEINRLPNNWSDLNSKALFVRGAIWLASKISSMGMLKCSTTLSQQGENKEGENRL